MNKFRFKGTVSIKHLNTRKEGEDDNQKLCVDLKLTALTDKTVFHFFDDQLPYALWLPGTDAKRNLHLGPLSFGHEHEGYRLECCGSTHHGVKVKKFNLAILDGGHVDLQFSVSFEPSGTEVATLAEYLADDIDITLEPSTEGLPFEGDDDGIWAISVSRMPERKDHAPPDSAGPTDSDLLAGLEGDDPMYEQAKQVVVGQQRASISLIQRHLRIGYNRAARLLEALEAEGVVSPMANDGSREVLATAEG